MAGGKSLVINTLRKTVRSEMSASQAFVTSLLDHVAAFQEHLEADPAVDIL